MSDPELSRLTELYNFRKRGFLKTEYTARSVLWSVENYHSVLASEQSICSNTFRIPTLSNCLFYLSLSLFGDVISLNVIRAIKNQVWSASAGHSVRILISLKDALNQMQLSRDLIMPKDNVSPPINFEIIVDSDSKLVNKACLEVQCTVINAETEQSFKTQKAKECEKLDKDYVPAISINELKEHLQVMLDGNVGNHLSIFVDDQVFQVHKTILCSQSPVFAAMFQHDTLEKENNRIYIDDIGAGTLGEILSFMYFGSTSKMTLKMAMDVFTAADKYDIKKLKRKCSNFIAINMTKEMVLEILIVADRHSDNELKGIVIQFLVNKAADIIETDAFIVFLETEPELARSILLHLVKIIAK